jgi:NADH-quinone oxidoreductase subunit L
MLTSAYMTRLTWLTFMGKERWRELPEEAHEEHRHSEPILAADAVEIDDPNGFYFASAPTEVVEHAHALTASHEPKEVPPSMWLPLVVLAALSIFGGFILSRNNLLQNWLTPVSVDTFGAPDKEPGFPLGWISLGAALLGIAMGIYIVSKERFVDSEWSPTRLWVRRQFGFDDAVTVAAVEGGAQFGRALDTGIEAGVIDRVVNGLFQLVSWVGRWLSAIQLGRARSYALMMLAGGILIVGYMVLSTNLHTGREIMDYSDPAATQGAKP